jgi:chromate transporter
MLEERTTRSCSTSRPGLVELAGVFLRIGNTTVGGGEPTIAAFQRELVRRGWLSPEQFGLSYALARLTPGTNMLAFCAAAGWYVLGLAGSAAGVAAVTVPSSVLVVWLTGVCEMGNQIPWLRAAVNATIAAGIGIMLAAVLMLVRGQISKSNWLRPAIVVAGAFGLRQAGLSPILTLAIAALLGLLFTPKTPS